LVARGQGGPRKKENQTRAKMGGGGGGAALQTLGGCLMCEGNGRGELFGPSGKFILNDVGGGQPTCIRPVEMPELGNKRGTWGGREKGG